MEDVTRHAISACHRAFEQEAAELEEHFRNGIVAALRNGIERHRAALEVEAFPSPTPPDREEETVSASSAADAREEADDTTGTGPDRDEDEPPESSQEESPLDPATLEALLAYRHAVMSQVLEPLRPHLTPGPVATLVDSFGQTVGSALSSCRALPEHVEVPWTSDALAPKSTDNRARRLAKPLARVLSSARKAGSPRPVPLRAVATRHFGRVVVPTEMSARIEACEAWAEWTRQLEVAWIAWAEQALEPLTRIEVPDGDAGREVAESAAAAARTLQARLEQLASEMPAAGAGEAIGARLQASSTTLSDDLAVAGSFFFRPRDPGGDRPDLRHLRKSSGRLLTLEVRFEGRLRMYFGLLALLTGTASVRERLVERFRKECLPSARGLLDIADQLEEALGSVDVSAGGRAVLDRVTEEITPILEPAVSLVPPLSEVEPIVSARAVEMVDAWYGVLRQMPDTLVLNSAEGRKGGRLRKVEARTVPLQQFVRQSFDALRVERARAAATRLTVVLEELRHAVVELPEALAYASEAAEKELEAEADDAEERASSLVTDAVRNVMDSLRSAVQDADLVIEDVRLTLATESRDGAISLLDRIRAGLMQAQLLRAQSRVATIRVWINENWGPPVDRAARRLRRRAVWLRRLATRHLRRGAEIVSGPAGEQAASAQSVKLLAESEAVTSQLPLVYQRLFTFDAVSDPALLAGRGSELADLKGRWGRWQEGDGVPIIVKGRQGSGISSLLNVFSAQVEAEGSSVARVELTERVSTEARIAQLLSDALGFPSFESFDEIAEGIFDAADLPDLVVLDNLEHLYLRVPGGTDLLERLLTLMSEAEPRSLWVGGIAASAWQLVATAEATAVTQVAVVDLSPLSPSAVRDAITVRYRRSGLPVRFEEPKGGRSLLRRKLRRARTAEAKRKLLQEDFFEQLQRASGSNLRLAYFQCLRSSEFGAGEGVLMKPPVRPDFSVLDTLTLTQNFTLKAFLEHRTMTLEEHDRIFRVERYESYQIFESLANRHLITPVWRPTGPGTDRSRVVEGVRYQVQPLLTGAVFSHLAGRNIVH